MASLLVGGLSQVPQLFSTKRTHGMQFKFLEERKTYRVDGRTKSVCRICWAKDSPGAFNKDILGENHIHFILSTLCFIILTHLCLLILSTVLIVLFIFTSI